MPIRIKDIREDVKRDLERIWKQREFKMTFPEFLALYVWAYNRADEIGIPDPETLVFELFDELDPSLSYSENQAILETKLLTFIPTVVQIPELEEHKAKVEDLEKRIEELEKIVPLEEIERLREDIKEWRERYKEAKKLFEEIKRTPGLTEEDVVRIIREQLKEFGKALGPALKALVGRVRKIEERVVRPEVRPATIEEAFEEWGPPAPFHSAELQPLGKQVLDHIKTILSLSFDKFIREKGLDPAELTTEELFNLEREFTQLSKESLDSLARQFYPSFPRQYSYFRWWLQRVESWREWWRRLA